MVSRPCDRKKSQRRGTERLGLASRGGKEAGGDVTHRFAVCILLENPEHDGRLGRVDLAFARFAGAAIAEGDTARDKAVADPAVDRPAAWKTVS